MGHPCEFEKITLCAYNFLIFAGLSRKMRHKLLGKGSKELSYKIREIVKKADLVQKAGQKVC